MGKASLNQSIELLKLIISTPSISREEGEVANRLQSYIERLSTKIKRVYRHHNNLWCISPEFDNNRPTILLDAHIDTVKPVSGWTRTPYTPIIDGDKIYGLGSNDDGASLVSMLTVFFKLCETKQSYNLIFSATAEEEVSGKDGLESVLPHLPPISCALIGEPTSMQPAIAEKGLMVLDCKNLGISGHAARTEGVNSIYEAMQDIQWFRTYNFPKESPLLGPVKMSVTQISAGTQHNVIPDVCNYVVDVRSNECYTNNEIFNIIRSNVKSEVTARSFRLNSSGISTEHPMVKRAIELGRVPFGSPTLSNQALLRIPSLKMGPGESSRSHTANEFITIDELKEGLEVYYNLLNGLEL